eukprot:9047662-Prorocentrum_lima.AAC.1
MPLPFLPLVIEHSSVELGLGAHFQFRYPGWVSQDFKYVSLMPIAYAAERMWGLAVGGCAGGGG